MVRSRLLLVCLTLLFAVSCASTQPLDPNALALGSDIAVPDEQELVDRLRRVVALICSAEPLPIDLVPHSDRRAYPCPVNVRAQTQESPSLVAFVFAPRPRERSEDYIIMASRTDQGWQFSAPAVLGPPLH